MKIALFSGGFLGGGAEASTISLANEFAQRGHCVSLIIKMNEGPLAALISEKVEVIDLDAASHKVAIYRMARVIKSRKFDFLMSGTPNMNITASLAKAFSWNKGTKLILVERMNFREFRKVQPSMWSEILLPILYPKADKVVVLSSGLREIVIQDLKCKPEDVVVIPNGFPLSQIRLASRDGVRHAWLDDQSVPVIVSAGRLRVIKDYGTLLEAFALVRLNRPCRLILIGEGPELENLRALSRRLGIEADVCFAGFQMNPFSFFARADLFVVSSKSEAFSRVLVEAMACGVPVVSTDCGGPREILENGRFGRLVPVGDVSALADAMEATLTQGADRSELVCRAQDFSIEKVADAYLQMFGVLNA